MGVMMVAGDAVYIRDYQYTNRSGVIIGSFIMARLQKVSQLRLMVQGHEIVTSRPLLYCVAKARNNSISCCHVSDCFRGLIILVCATVVLDGLEGQVTSNPLYPS